MMWALVTFQVDVAFASVPGWQWAMICLRQCLGWAPWLRCGLERPRGWRSSCLGHAALEGWPQGAEASPPWQAYHRLPGLVLMEQCCYHQCLETQTSEISQAFFSLLWRQRAVLLEPNAGSLEVFLASQDGGPRGKPVTAVTSGYMSGFRCIHLQMFKIQLSIQLCSY